MRWILFRSIAFFNDSIQSIPICWYYLLDTIKMTPEIICSIVFGIVASILALVTSLQAHRKRLVSGMLSHSCCTLKTQNGRKPALKRGVPEVNTNSHPHWYGQTFRYTLARSHSLPSFRSGTLTPLPPVQCHVHGRDGH